MASAKMCKPAHETGPCHAPIQAQARPCGPCGSHVPEKKQHFWHRQQHNNEQGFVNAHGPHKITQCFGAYGAKPAHHGGAGHGAHYEKEEYEVVRVEKKEEQVSIIHRKSNSRGGKKCAEHYKYSDSSDSESDNEGKGRRKNGKC